MKEKKETRVALHIAADGDCVVESSRVDSSRMCVLVW